jgi:3-hydroxyacyl-[acyl-carrier-protein] dehydratase
VAVTLESVLRRVPHRAPFALIDRLLVLEADRAVAEKRLSAADPLVGGGLRGPLCIEALAQTAACVMVGRLGQGQHAGYLVAAAGWKFPGEGRSGETVRLEAVLVAELGSLVRFSGRATVGGRELAAGTLTLAIAGIDEPADGAGRQDA